MEKRSNKLLIITGHSGAGKDTVSDELRKVANFTQIVPHTTRNKRIGETEGAPYYFISTEKFLSMIDNEEFVEYKSYVTQFDGIESIAYYGTAKSSILTDKSSIITIGVGAAIQLKKLLGTSAEIIYLHVSDTVREERAKTRGSFDKIEWDNRLAQDHARFGGEIPSGMDAIIDNMQPLSDTIKKILEIVDKDN